MLTTDDRAGGVYRYADVDGASFGSYLHYAPAWSLLPTQIKDTLPFVRQGANAPGYTGGYHTSDRTYSAQNTGFTRNSYRPL
ncbi:hypothetical protein [Nocardia wallacei]|uniref:HORMA-1 domain-containing protein n=1 Tax=Nocardia wallacei TaxID=480035 RepID=UPI003CC7D8DF